MKKVLLVIGNITFNHFEEEEMKLFKRTDAIRFALVHDINCIVECDTVEEAEILGEEALCVCCESYLIPSVFETKIQIPEAPYSCGEVAYE